MIGRDLGPEMAAEGWETAGDLATEAHARAFWCYSPRRESVSVTLYPRHRCDSPGVGPEPSSPEAPGYVVAHTTHDDLGNPTSGASFWVESLGSALRYARTIRRSVLDQRPRPTYAEQGELFPEASS